MRDMSSTNLYNMNCLDILKVMESNSIDSMVTDPPYGLGIVKDVAGLLKAWMSGDNGDDFMGGNGFLGKKWDKIVIPPGGVILDPFMGSGSIGIEAIINNFKYIGIEKEPEYFDIARKRIEFEEKEHGGGCS